MRVASDYRDLLKGLNRHKVRYLIIGAYAVIYYTEPRFTKDLDIWIEPESENADRLYKALRAFGAPLKGIASRDFTNKKLVYQIGIEPVRADIIMGIPGIGFNYAWRRKRVTSFDGIKVNIIGINELIASKRKTRRTADAVDVERLRYSLRLNKRK
jgi:predicted nucleotidyltransferase